MSSESLGDRMKRYEDSYRIKLPRRVPKVLRIDGRAFHTYLRNAKKPYDTQVMECMVHAASEVLKDIGGIARFAYVQSDECSIVINDALDINTQPWFDNNLQKVSSVSASIFSCAFNSNVATLPILSDVDGWAVFDARFFIVPDPQEVVNCMIWRQQDATRNSIEQYGRSMFSHAEMQNKNNAEVQEMMFQKGFNWDAAPTWTKRGAVVTKEKVDWEIPIFTQDPKYLIELYYSKLEEPVPVKEKSEVAMPGGGETK